MNLMRILFCVASLLISIPCFAQETKTAAASNVEKYFPMKKGFTWNYHTTVHNTKTKTELAVLDNAKKISHSDTKPDGSILLEITESKYGVSMSSEIYTYKNGVVSLISLPNPIATSTLSIPRPYLKANMMIGTSWIWKGKIVNKVYPSPPITEITTTLISEEDVTVPAGIFHAIHIKRKTVTLSDGFPPTTSDEWYAPGIGVVQEKQAIGDIISDSSLVSYSAGGDVPKKSISYDTVAKFASIAYFPCKPGSKWVYTGDPLTKGDFQLKVSGFEPDTKSSGIVMVLQRSAPGGSANAGIGSEYRYIASENEIQPANPGDETMMKLLDLRVLSPALKLPLKAGTAWNTERVFDTKDSTGQSLHGIAKSKFTVIGREMVTVPAGKFQAWRIKEIFTISDGKTSDDPKMTLETWFVEKIGVVKRKGTSPISDFTQNLKSYEIK